MLRFSKKEAFIGKKRIKLIKRIEYSNRIEREVEFHLEDLKGVKVKEYPDNLLSEILVNDEFTVSIFAKLLYFVRIIIILNFISILEMEMAFGGKI